MERITITLTPEMAQTARGAVEAGEYASSSKIIREALRDWRHKRALQAQEGFDRKSDHGRDSGSHAPAWELGRTLCVPSRWLRGGRSYDQDPQELAHLRAAAQEDLDDIEAGRVRDFDAERIIRRGEERLQRRPSPSE